MTGRVLQKQALWGLPVSHRAPFLLCSIYSERISNLLGLGPALLRGLLRKETRGHSNTSVTVCKSCEFCTRHLVSLCSTVVFCAMGTWGSLPTASGREGLCPAFRAVDPRPWGRQLVTSDDVTAPPAVQQVACTSAVLSSHSPGHTHPALRWLVTHRPCSALLGHSLSLSCVCKFPQTSKSL